MGRGTDGGAFHARSLELGGQTFRYQVWLPPGWTEARAWPVVLFLHGAGERGDDGVVQTREGLGPALRAHPERWPALAVFPQAHGSIGWRGPNLRQAVAALDAAMLEFRGDTQRQYLTGISMGGYGSWRLALDHPERFAALVPVCGGLDAAPAALARAAPADEHPADAAARALRHLPVWIFHGDADPIIHVAQSRVMVEALRRAGAEPRYTEYPGVGHNSWDAAYGEAELAEWMMRQKKG